MFKIHTKVILSKLRILVLHTKTTINHKESSSLLSFGQRVLSFSIKRDRARQSVVVIVRYRVPIPIACGRLRQKCPESNYLGSNYTVHYSNGIIMMKFSPFSIGDKMKLQLDPR